MYIWNVIITQFDYLFLAERRAMYKLLFDIHQRNAVFLHMYIVHAFVLIYNI